MALAVDEYGNLSTTFLIEQDRLLRERQTKLQELDRRLIEMAVSHQLRVAQLVEQ